MAQFLTEDTTFSCIECGAKFFAKELGGGRATAAGHKVLSISAKLFIKGALPPVCPFVPGSPPPPCTYIPGSAMFSGSGADYAHKHVTDALLTEQARWKCVKGGTITVSDIGRSKNKFYQGNCPISVQRDKTVSQTLQKNENMKEAKSATKPDASIGTETISAENSDATFAEMDSGAGVLRKEELHKSLKCRKCAQADKCETLAEICASNFVCSSATLKKNYADAVIQRIKQPARSFEYLWSGHAAHTAFKNAEEAEARAGVKWRYAAHHILSGLQVVEKNKALLSLFKAFAYDINCAENCVMLLGKASDVSLKDMEEAEKNVHKYDCMARGRLQWHGGHHRYKINGSLVKKIEAQLVMHKIKNPENIKCYAELLELRLEDISEKWGARKHICPKLACDDNASPDSPHRRARTDFFNDINRLAEEIRRELTEFAQKPHRSYPWFVSMATWMYAFNLLHTSYIIAISDNGVELELEKFRLTRHGKTLETDGQTLAIEKKEVFKFANRNPTVGNIRECVEFCGNIIFFAMKESLGAQGGFADAAGSSCLGFHIEAKDIFTLQSENPEAELTREQTRLLVWIGDRDYKGAPGECGLKSSRLAAASRAFGMGTQ